MVHFDYFKLSCVRLGENISFIDIQIQESYYNKLYYKIQLGGGTQLTKLSTHVWIQALNQSPS